LRISPITTEEFERFRRLIYDHAGIALAPEKKVMVASRLAKRLNYFGLSNYGEYLRLVTERDQVQEFQMFVNILTTNETYFFREPKHFAFFRDQVLKVWRGNGFRVWSAACSTGEEVYSLAMVMAEDLGMRDWQVLGSDISTGVLETARRGIYLCDRLEYMDSRLMEKYCLKGVRSRDGFLKIDANLRKRVNFDQVNLTAPLPPDMGQFDVIFLRNVLIYFDQETKTQVVERLLNVLKPGGYFFVSHSESLHRVTERLKMIKPSIYRKP